MIDPRIAHPLLALALMAAFPIAAFLMPEEIPAPPPPSVKLGEKIRSERKELSEESAARLNALGWEDRAAGAVRLPIDQAITRTIEELNAPPAGEEGSPP